MAISSRDGDEHDMKWGAANMALGQIGFWVKWQRNFYTDQYQYALGKRGEHMPMGIYEDEDTARAMVKMLWTNANDGG